HLYYQQEENENWLTSFGVEYPPELPESLLETSDIVREHDDVLLLHHVALGRPLAAHRVHGEGAGGGRRGAGPARAAALHRRGLPRGGWHDGGGGGVHSLNGGSTDGVHLFGRTAL
ncbi:hypothetical protein AVEN_104695-1, partial [Araneus ventricosus]